MHLKTISLFKYLAILFVCLISSLTVFFYQPIFYESKPKMTPDFIVILGGGGGVRLNHYAKTSYIKYPDVPIVLTGGLIFYGKPDAEHMSNHSETLGIQTTKILIPTSQSTFDDALHLRKYFLDKGLNPSSLMIITSDFHSGRAFWVFKKVFPSLDIDMSPAPDKLINTNWWHDYNTTQAVLEEKARFLFYRLVVFLNPSILNI